MHLDESNCHQSSGPAETARARLPCRFPRKLGIPIVVCRVRGLAHHRDGPRDNGDCAVIVGDRRMMKRQPPYKPECFQEPGAEQQRESSYR